MKINPTYYEDGSLIKRIGTTTKGRGIDIDYMIYRFKWWMYPNFHYLEKCPVHLDIEITNACNLRCPMCVREHMGSKRGFMQFDLFKKIIDEGASLGLKSIKLNWRGEPTLHPQIIEMVSYAKKKGIIEVSFNTNGTLLTEELAKSLIDAGLDQIIFSFDAAEKDIYEDVRVGADFDKVVENIKRFHFIRDKEGKKLPFTRIQMVEMQETEEQVPKFKNLWGPVVDKIAIVDYKNPGGLDKDRSIDGVKDNNKNNKFACCQLWQRLFIAWDGSLAMCCQDFNQEFPLGNIKTQSLTEIWKGKSLTYVRKMHVSGNVDKIDICRKCGLRNAS